MDLVKVHVCVFLDRIDHGQTLKRLGEVDLKISIMKYLGSGHFFCHITVQFLGQIHHAVVIGICLIKLHQRKFRIVSGIKSFVTEYTSDLIDTLHAADDQSL